MNNSRSTTQVLIVLVSLLALDPANAGFDDTLETSFGPAANNLAWSSFLTTPGLGVAPTVVAGTPCVSAGCVKFEFTGNADLAATGHSELLLTDGGAGSQELWIEWSQFFESTWLHRQSTSTDDNEFFKLILADADTQVRFLFDLAGTNETLDAFITTMGGTTNTLLGHGTGTGAGIAHDATKKNKWLKVRAHIKLGTMAAPNSGVIELFIDGTSVVSLSNVNLFAAGGNAIQQVRFMGFANSGFDATSRTFIDDVAVARRPRADIVLVIDRSGSMEGRIDPADMSSAIKFPSAKNAAKAAVDALMPFLTLADRIGVVFFNGDAIPKLNPANPATVFLPGSASAATVKALIDQEANGGGSTSVGDGLGTANAMGFASDAATNQLILLVTDGYQNTADFVVQDTTWNGMSPAFNIGPSESTGGTAYPPSIKVCVVAIGLAGGGQFLPFNEKMSDKRCPLTGMTITTLKNGNPAPLLGAFFNSIIVPLALGDKVEQIGEAEGSIAAGASAAETFVVSKRDLRVSIPIMFSNPNMRLEVISVGLVGPHGEQIRLDPALKRATLIRSPTDQVVLAAEIQFERGRNYFVVSFPLPLDSNEMPSFDGEWQVVLSRRQDDFPATGYGMLFYADNESLVSELAAVCNDCGTGETVDLRARLTESGEPVLGATVTVTVASPNDGVGNVLSTNPTPSGDVDSSGDVLSPADKKLLLLLENPDIRDRLLGSAKPDLTLRDPDRDGVYTGRYTMTTVPGDYEFTFRVAGTTTENGRFTRLLKEGSPIRPKPAPGNSDIVVMRVDGQPGINATLTFTPRDRFGNFLGPGFANLIRVMGKDGTLVGTPTDNLDGSYALNLALTNASARPDISVGIGPDQVDVRRRRWWWWLLLLVIPLLN